MEVLLDSDSALNGNGNRYESGTGDYGSDDGSSDGGSENEEEDDDMVASRISKRRN